MTSRERILCALSHHRPDRTPRLLHDALVGAVPAVRQLMREKLGDTDPATYFAYDVCAVERAPGSRASDFRGYNSGLRPGEELEDEWGVRYVAGSTYHFLKSIPPLANATSLKVLDAYPFPDIDAASRHAHLATEVAARHAEGLAVAGYPGEVLATTLMLRGFEQVLVDMAEGSAFLQRLLDEVTERVAASAEQFVQAGIDALILADDVSTQQGPMMSLDMWRRWLRPTLSRQIERAKRVRPDIHIFYHSDGNCQAIIPDLIEVGVDTLNPVQPECMDPAELKREYGRDLSFWGTIGVQSTMPFGTPGDVEREVRRRVETVGYDGGLVLSPCHVLEPEVHWDNIVAFFEACDRWG